MAVKINRGGGSAPECHNPHWDKSFFCAIKMLINEMNNDELFYVYEIYSGVVSKTILWKQRNQDSYANVVPK